MPNWLIEFTHTSFRIDGITYYDGLDFVNLGILTLAVIICAAITA